MKKLMLSCAIILPIFINSSNVMAMPLQTAKSVLELELVEEWPMSSQASSLKEIDKIKFLSCSERPVYSEICPYQIQYDEKKIVLPNELARELEENRALLSLETSSGGIIQYPKSDIKCRLGGPARGFRLSGVYFFDKKQSSFIESEYRVLYEEKLNCLFQVEYEPTNSSAIEAAKKIREILFSEVLRDLQK